MTPESNRLEEFSLDQNFGTEDSTPADGSTWLEIEEGLGSQTDYHTMDSPQRELFKHYITHTAPSLAIDTLDLYALSTGIRRLACDSNIILDSILALAAIHQCYQLLERSIIDELTYNQVTLLLVRAEQYHGQSLRQTRMDAKHMSRYDHVMANAALMVLYGCAWQSVSIRLMGIDIVSSPLGKKLAPARLQWISLIWAIRIAYSGLVDTKSSFGEVQDSSFQSHSLQKCRPHRVTQSFIEEARVDIHEQEGPSETTRQMFLPIVARTWNKAFEKLLERSFVTAEDYQHDAVLPQETLGSMPESSCLSDIYVCVSTLNLLYGIFLDTFPCHTRTECQDSSPYDHRSDEAAVSLDGVSNIEPWLHSYLARITSNTANKPFRRTIMAFIHRMPARFLMLVHETLGNSPIAWSDAVRDTTYIDPARARVQRLVVDIFAHWLVLVTLLDGVWWIGEIGTWELEGVISAMLCLNKASDVVALEDDWWPSSMFTIRHEIGKCMR